MFDCIALSDKYLRYAVLLHEFDAGFIRVRSLSLAQDSLCRDKDSRTRGTREIWSRMNPLIHPPRGLAARTPEHVEARPDGVPLPPSSACMMVLGRRPLLEPCAADWSGGPRPVGATASSSPCSHPSLPFPVVP